MLNFVLKGVDFNWFGYIFLLIVKEGGVLCRVGYIEVVVDLVKLCGVELVGVICEIINEDGMMVCVFDLIECVK